MKVASLMMRVLYYLGDICAMFLWMLLTYNTVTMIYLWVTKSWHNYYLIPIISAIPLMIFLVPYAILMFLRVLTFMYTTTPSKFKYVRTVLNTICLVFGIINSVIYLAAFLLVLLLYSYDPWGVSTLAAGRWMEVVVLTITDGAIFIFLLVASAILGISTWDFAISF